MIPAHCFIEAFRIAFAKLADFFELAALCHIWKLASIETRQPRVALVMPRAGGPTGLSLAYIILAVERLAFVVL